MRKRDEPESWLPASPAADAPCPLCGRPLGALNIDRHHLIPRTFKGKEQFPIHRICHRKIHSALTERELLREYHTWEALKAHPEIRDFVEWVARKDPGFYSRSFSTNRKKGR